MKPESFNPEDVSKELRAKHAKLNELSEAQSDAANAALSDALTIGFSTGFVEGLVAEQKQRVKVLIPILTFRTFVVSLVALPVAGGLLTATSNVGLSFLGTAMMMSITFYFMDKFFYQILPTLVTKAVDASIKRKAAKQKKDELPQ